MTALLALLACTSGVLDAPADLAAGWDPAAPTDGACVDFERFDYDVSAAIGAAAPFAVALHNRCDQPVDLSAIALVDLHGGFVLGDAPEAIPAGGSAEVPVTFTASGPIIHVGLLQIESSDPALPFAQIELFGQASRGLRSGAPPVAHIAAKNQYVDVGELTPIDGSGSTDPEGDALTYSWTFLSGYTPADSALSNADISGAATHTASITPDAAGQFRLRFVVGDGSTTSKLFANVWAAEVGNSAPSAWAGPNTTLTLGDDAALDGGGSSDLDGDALTYRWSFASAPAGSALSAMADIEQDGSAAASFTPDVAGTYNVRMVVSDGVYTAKDFVKIFVEESAEEGEGCGAADASGYATWSGDVDSVEVIETLCDAGDDCVIDGLLEVRGTDLTDLSALDCVISVTGQVSLWNNDSLTSFSGLENLGSVGGVMYVKYNDAIDDLSGLGGLTSVGDLLEISYNDAMTSLDGADSLTTVGGSLEIIDNDAMTGLGLEALTEIGEYFEVSGNAALVDLSGLESVTAIGDDITIEDNAALTALTGLEGLTATRDLSIEDNGSLTALDGLENITRIRILEIRSNGALTTLSGLESLTQISHEFTLYDNTSLTSLEALSGLTSVTSHASISGNTALTTLAGLEGVTEFGGSLTIGGNTALTTLAGLESLTEVGYELTISDNDALTSLEGLENLEAAWNGLILSDNDALTSLAALESLTDVGFYYGAGWDEGLLTISGNDALTTLDGFIATSPVAYITVEDNAALADVSAMLSLGSPDTGLYIRDNPCLPESEAKAAHAALGYGATDIDVSNNTGPCP